VVRIAEPLVTVRLRRREITTHQDNVVTRLPEPRTATPANTRPTARDGSTEVPLW
jgi:hypothetical protein